MVCTPFMLPLDTPPAVIADCDARMTFGPSPSGAALSPVRGQALAVTMPRMDAAPPAPGHVEQRFLDNDPGLPYFVYVPVGGGAAAPMMVSVHGISRNAREHARMFAPFAERRGVVIVAPLFTPGRFADYQRLVRNERGESPVDVLDRIVGDVARMTGAGSERLHLFGYSGGAQFVHRFAMAYPERVAAYVVGAAGWYTFPDLHRRYPYGLRYNWRLDIGGFEPKRFLTIPGWVMVGERDAHVGTAMRRTERVMREQGGSRIERGERWVTAMNATAQALGLKPPIRFETLPRSAHSFRRSVRRGDMGARVFERLFGAAAPSGEVLLPAAASRR